MNASGCDHIDRYLLGEPVSKPAAIEAALGERSTDPAAAPFYRALDAVGPRAADEALVALRLVLAGKAPDDEAVRELRAFAQLARACAMEDAAGAKRVLARDPTILSPLQVAAGSGDLTQLAREARTAYHAALAS